MQKMTCIQYTMGNAQDRVCPLKQKQKSIELDLLRNLLLMTARSGGEIRRCRWRHQRFHQQRRVGADRSACQTDRTVLQLLSGAVRGHHLHHPHPPEDALLLLQPHRPVRHLLVDGSARIHASARFRREAHTRSAALSHFFKHFKLSNKVFKDYH